MNLPSWPNGAHVAVLVSVLLEAWSDEKSPSYFPRTTPLKGGQIDRAGARWSEYGGKEGIWRQIKTLDDRGIRGTVFSNALAAERYPSHGELALWMNDNKFDALPYSQRFEA